MKIFFNVKILLLLPSQQPLPQKEEEQILFITFDLGGNSAIFDSTLAKPAKVKTERFLIQPWGQRIQIQMVSEIWRGEWAICSRNFMSQLISLYLSSPFGDC